VTTTLPLEVGGVRLHDSNRVDESLGWVYFSVVIHTTLGLGDLVPSGSIRFLLGTQALVGFTLRAWSGAFTFRAMERCRRERSDGRQRPACGADRGRAAGD
jgi:hypothetical protein